MKILICDGDDVVQEIEIEDKFLFLITDDKRVYHLDSADGNIYEAHLGLKNLGAGHRKILKKHGVKK